MGSTGASCYFPNGDLASDNEIPCGEGDGVACCPLNWECQDNGLCYLPNEGWYGRYACTDKSWQSSECPNICTQDNTAIGAEAILECSTGSFCCDANRPDAEGDDSLGCCQKSSDRFSIENRAMVSASSDSSDDSASDTTSSSSSIDTPSDTPTPVISTPAPDTTQSTSTSEETSATGTAQEFNGTPVDTPSPSPSSRTPDRPTTVSTIDHTNNDNNNNPRPGPDSSTTIIRITSIITSPNGQPTTLTTSRPSIITAPIATPSPTSPSSSPSTSSNSKANIIAPAVAVPLAVLAIAGLLFFCLRRRKQKRASKRTYEHDEPVNMYPEMKQGFPEEDGKDSDIHTSPGSYESPNHIGAGGVAGGMGGGHGGEKFGAGAGGAGLGLAAAAAAPAYRGGETRPGEATRVERERERQSELPGSPVVSSSGVSPETIHQREDGCGVGGVGGYGSGAAGGQGGGGGLHVVNPTPEPEPSELPGSTYHAYKPYRRPGTGGT